MISVETISSRLIEVHAVCGSNNVSIDVQKHEYGIRLHFATSGITHLTVNNAIKLGNAINQAVSIANEFDYCVEKYKKQS